MMNRIGLICRYIQEHPCCTQRELAAKLDLSLGTINTLLKECNKQQFISQGKNHSDLSAASCAYELTPLGKAFLDQFRVDGALIIAAGFGSRFVPLTFEMPKGLLEVFGERMVERQIKQLHQAGITDITIMVGYLKEKFEYLIDLYGVNLIYNPEYSCKNTLATLYRAQKILQGRNMYVLSSDNWLRENMFHSWECGAWYSSVYQEGSTSEWVLSYNKKKRITHISIGGHDSWVMYGPVYFSKEFSQEFLPLLIEAYQTPGTEQFYWEHVLMEHIDKLEMDINRQPANQVYEFENLEELRLFDPKYQTHSDSKAMELVSQVFQMPEGEIHDIRCLKSGMTNNSFLFQLKGRHYICRIPGAGTEMLINRQQEASVYEAVEPLGITEHVVYLDRTTGYKIAEYYEGSRNAQADSLQDMTACMQLLRCFHQSGISVAHEFNIRERIDFYENLCRSSQNGMRFEDYAQVREWMDELLLQLEQQNRPKTLSHIDSNVDNFLFLPDGNVRLIDWEYAGMCDPLIDLGMCAIYSYYNDEETEQLMECYFGRPATKDERLIVYAYMALGGFLWALWAVYKSAQGEEFGDYTLIMYRYAKRYYKKYVSARADMTSPSPKDNNNFKKM